MFEGRKGRLLMDAIERFQQGKGSAEEYVAALSEIDAQDAEYAAELTQALGIEFNSRVDGLGAFYGHWQGPDGSELVNVFPPREIWNGDCMPLEPQLHETDWIVTIAGDVVGQAANIGDLAEIVQGYSAKR